VATDAGDAQPGGDLRQPFKIRQCRRLEGPHDSAERCDTVSYPSAPKCTPGRGSQRWYERAIRVFEVVENRLFREKHQDETVPLVGPTVIELRGTLSIALRQQRRFWTQRLRGAPARRSHRNIMAPKLSSLNASTRPQSHKLGNRASSTGDLNWTALSAHYEKVVADVHH